MSKPSRVRELFPTLTGQALLNTLSQFVRDVNNALAGNLTPSENLAQCWVEVDITYGQPIPVIALPALKGRTPYGVSVENATVLEGSLGGAPGIQWEATTKNGAPALKVLSANGLNAGAKVTLRLLVKAE